MSIKDEVSLPYGKGKAIEPKASPCEILTDGTGLFCIKREGSSYKLEPAEDKYTTLEEEDMIPACFGR